MNIKQISKTSLRIVTIVCAIHCVVLPFLSLLPAIGASFINSPQLEVILVATALFFAGVSSLHGYFRHHRQKWIPALFVLSLVLVLVSTVPFRMGSDTFDSWGDWLRAVAMLFLLLLYYYNYKYTRLHLCQN